MIDFSEQRRGDLERASGRRKALDAGRRTRAILETYVSARRGDPTLVVNWRRVLLAIAVVALAIAGLFKLAL